MFAVICLRTRVGHWIYEVCPLRLHRDLNQLNPTGPRARCERFVGAQ